MVEYSSGSVTFYIVFDSTIIAYACINPAVVNRTFGDRTQSNSNRSTDFDWFRQSNMIDLTQNFCQSNTIERSEMEASKIVHKSRFISFQTRRCCQQISYVLPSISNTSTQGRCRREQRQRKPWNYQFWKRVVINEGYHGCPFAVGVDVKFIFEKGV